MSASATVRTRTLFTLAAILLVAPAEGLGQEPLATVTGRVVDETGSFVPHEEIQILRDGRRIGRGESDGQGRYQVTVAPGPLRVLLVGGMGWTSVESDSVSVAPGEIITVDLVTERQIYDVEQVFVSVEGPGSKITEGDVIGWVDRVEADDIRQEVHVDLADALREQAGADVVDTGLGGRVVTFRGFNNVFSGALRYLVDYRKASLPSLRANFTHFVPTQSSDVESMELVLGPSSAIYGPNSANGVLNVVTRSPLGLPETYFAMSGGSQSLGRGDIRTSQRLGDRVGIKVSARWFQAREYPYLDPVEAEIRELVEADPEIFRDRLRDLGVPEDEIRMRERRVGIRDPDIERWSADARVDWTPSAGDTLVVQAGRMTTTGIEVTPLGAAQAGGWQYDYLQGRLHSGALFAQAYVNTSDAGDTYLLRDGAPLVDRSRMVGAQIRHAFILGGGRETITYGGDWSRTNPRTGGTIHGQFERDDAITEFGGYAQSRTRILEPLQLIATLRVDESNVIEDPVFSPRVGIVVEPAEGQTLSASWSRGFSTPTPTNYFLDISAGSAPGLLGQLGYRIRARGTGREGIRFSDGQGGFQGMRSPCTPDEMGGPSQLVPVAPALMWQCALGILQEQGGIAPDDADFLRSLDPTGSVTVNAFDPVTGGVRPLSSDVVDDVSSLLENTTSTYEVGYRGMLGERIFIQTALWRTEKENFVSPLQIRTPLLTLDGPEMAAFLIASGVPADRAQDLAEGIAPIPLAVLSSEDVEGSGAELLTTYQNYGSITYWGVDLGTTVALSRSLTLSGAASMVSDDHFDVEGQLVPLNAPEFKGSLGLGVDNLSTPVNGEIRLRHHSGFPVASGEYIGTRCILEEASELVQECVDAATLLDATVGYDVSSELGFTVSVSNVLGTDYRPFVGVPTTGRRILARLEYRMR